MEVTWAAPTGQRSHREAAGVAITVEHALKAPMAGVRGKARPAVALVEVEAGLVASGDVQRQAPVVFADAQLGGAVAAQPAGGLRQALKRAHTGIRALVEAAEPGGAQQGVGDHVLPALDAAGGELRHQRVGVAVDDQAGQAIGFAMDQAQAVTADVEQLARAHRALDERAQKRGVNALLFVKAPGPGTDARSGAERRPGQEVTGVRLDAHRFAGVSPAAGDGRIKYPGVAAQQGAFLAFFETDGFHQGIVVAPDVRPPT
jgi:hypothetical protein